MKIIIDGKKIDTEGKDTILEIAKKEGFDIPHLCNHSDLCVTGSCRLCMVSVLGRRDYFAACSLYPEEGMEILTSNPEIEKIRKINLELLFSQHKEECRDCVWEDKCKLLELAEKHKVKVDKFQDRKRNYPIFSFGGIIDFDSSKCVDCRNCIEACDEQSVSFLKMKEKGYLFEVEPDSSKSCTYCGQCILHCPGGSFEGEGEFESGEDFKIYKKSKNISFQIAPATRISIGEEFDLPPGTVSTGQLVAGLRKIGISAIYDVSFAADFTTIEEAGEFLEKMENDELPLFTSCCPAWVRFVESYYPEFIGNLTTVRSPQIISGGLIKTLSGRPDKEIVVSVMPCVSKKYEAQREELFLKNGVKPVDHVLTVREVARILKSEGIDISDLEEDDFDEPLGLASRDGINYGMSGGVTEAALRQAANKVGAKLEDEVRNFDEFTCSLNEKKIKTKRISGLKAAAGLLEELKSDPGKYDYVEVMACPGGCIGGGGQPVPSNREIVSKRRMGLSNASKSEVESAFKNKKVEALYGKIKDHDIFHTEYSEKNSSENIFIKNKSLETRWDV